MEIRMDSQVGPVLSGIDPVVSELQEKIRTCPQEWLKALQKNPQSFANLEQEIHRAFAGMADRVLAGLLAQATAVPEFIESAKKK